MHDGYLNRYSFTKDCRRTILAPLSSKEVYEDQCKLERLRVEAERKEKESRKSNSEGEKNKSEKQRSGKGEPSEKKEGSEKHNDNQPGQKRSKSVSLIASSSQVRYALSASRPIFVLL